MKAGANVRKIDKTDYGATHKDYSEPIVTIHTAVAVLKTQAYDRKQRLAPANASALKALALIQEEAKRVTSTFLMQKPGHGGLGASVPGANGYESEPSGVIDMLEKLLEMIPKEAGPDLEEVLPDDLAVPEATEMRPINNASPWYSIWSGT